MQDHRQLIRFRQLKLLLKKALLLIKLRIVAIEIQPDLADRHQLTRPLLQ